MKAKNYKLGGDLLAGAAGIIACGPAAATTVGGGGGVAVPVPVPVPVEGGGLPDTGGGVADIVGGGVPAAAAATCAS
jgi:hypothetical protein